MSSVMLKRMHSTSKNKKTPSIIYQKQYIGHARHEGPYRENSLPLFKYLITNLQYKIIEADVVFTSDRIPVLNHGVEGVVFYNGERQIININDTTYAELKLYSFSQDDYVPITILDDILKLCYQHDVCILLDLTFQKYTFTHLKTINHLLYVNNMKSNTIWGDVNVFKLALIDHNAICQVGGSWGRKMLIESFFKSFFCRQLIMSFYYYGGEIESFKQIVNYGHKLGFIMKVATINEIDIAKKFWQIDVDLINTDTLLNNEGS